MASVGSGSRQKGSNFERKVAKQLSLWWGHTFHRTPGSGSLHWQSENNVAGDIVATPSSGFPFVCECKNQEAGNWTLESVVLGKHDVKYWWQQVVADARRVDRVPLLIFTRNRSDEFIMMPYEENLYEDLLMNKQSVARTVVTYTDKMTEVTESFQVLITNYAGLVSLPPRYYIGWAREHDWEELSLINYPDEPEEAEGITTDDLMGKIKKSNS